ncbi:hypothetical protein SG26_14040 [Haloarcula sp. CBA1115]|nr:hypothetical protein SG26_14040 [Haloarcula sp. CBA1115]KAA9407396.1 hypothetical protein Har1131_11475 [Haloarcula sp. CBA1131]KZX48351.1 hypothetical protein AV929_05135 [Haloarcula sp. K1]
MPENVGLKPYFISVSRLKLATCAFDDTHFLRRVGPMANDALVLLFMIAIVLVVMAVTLIGGFYLVKYLVERTFNS